MADTSPRDEDDTGGEPVFLIRPSENVYSYFMFIGPTETKRKQDTGINWNVFMGYLLVAMNFFMQSVLLALIFEEVVAANIDWQNGILKLGKTNPDDPSHHVTGLLMEAPVGCNDGAALCFYDSTGAYTCAPPSVQLTGRWTELDTDSDGVWTREEVTKAREDLKCKYVVDPVEVFDVLVNMLKGRENLIWLHPKLKDGSAIHLPYFTYAMADLIMCGYRNKDMCPNLIERGFFDAPMRYGTAPRVGNTIDSALHYCRSLLEPGGTCERLLPSTYSVWKVQGQSECGEPEYEQFQYTNPGSGVQKSLLSVSYSKPAEYELAHEAMFRLFKGIMIFLWLLLMTVEIKDIIKILTLCARYPRAEEFGEDAVIKEVDPSDPEDVRYRIQGITRNHRVMMTILCFLRFVVICVLLFVGVSYLIQTNGYSDLLMNGVALAFIAEISVVLYSQVLREEVKDQTEDIKALKVPMYGIDWLNRRPALVDILWVVILAITVWMIMAWQMTNIVQPVFNALSCTCTVSGESCVEAQRYNFDFWQNYWRFAVPQVFHDVDRLKQGVAGASYLAVASSAHHAFDKQAAGATSHRASGADKALEQRLNELESKHSHLEAELSALEAVTQSTPVARAAGQTEGAVVDLKGPPNAREQKLGRARAL